MTTLAKSLTALSLVAALAACNGAGNNRVDTIGEVEATTDTAITGSTVPGPGGTQVQP